jgi:mannose-1-phosphate guanylyltransferase
MKAMVLAAGLGTRLRPLTYEIPKPMVPLIGRPVMAHVIDLCRRHGFDRLIANLHYRPSTITDYFGDSIEYSYEEELLGTAGGVRNVRDFFGDDPIVVVSGDSPSDMDLNKLVDRHRSAGGIATLTVKQVDHPTEYGIVLHDSHGRISAFQEKPHPDEALSNLANCGIYCFSAEIFDYFPDAKFVDWANDVFPALLEHDVPLYVHEIDDYWSDVGSLDELRAATFDALTGALKIQVPESAAAPADAYVDGDVWIGEHVTIGSGVRLLGSVVVGAGSTIGDRAALRDTIVLPGATVGDEQIVIGAIQGHSARLRGS